MKFKRLSKFLVCLLVSSLMLLSSISVAYAYSFHAGSAGNTTVSTQAPSSLLKSHMLTSFKANPMFRSKPSLSPGGDNMLVFKYTLSGAADVRIELQKSGVWYTLLDKAETKGSKAFAWDGQVEGNFLSPGTYSLRAYSLYQGIKSKQYTFKVQIYPAPKLKGTLSINYLKERSGKKITLTLKSNIPTNINVSILDQSSNVVATVFNKSSVLPGAKKITWNGKNSSKAYVAAGDYFFKISAGTATLVIPVKVTPPLNAKLIFDTLGGLQVDVRDGSGALSKGAAWDELTSYPGTPGNCVIFGHRTTVFKTFGSLKLGDPIHLKVGGSVFDYKIINMVKVLPGDPIIRKTYDSKMLTLVTCYPFIWRGHAPRRYVVIAEQLE